MNGKNVFPVIARAMFFRPKQSPRRVGDCFSKTRSAILSFLLSSFLLFSCSTSTPPSTPQVVSVYSSSFTQPWLTELYDCAVRSSVTIRLSDSASAADIRLQIGEPEVASFAYQIDSEEILIVTQRQSPIQNLTLDEAQALFMGLGDPSVQVWVYASDTDVQKVFDQLVMNGRSVSSSAMVAVSPEQMSDTLVNQPNTVGILPKHWKAGDSRVVFSAGTVPVLALTKSEPVGVVKNLLTCMQKSK
ncbi:MAG: hypothetical protein ABI904_16330 [Chloroflexota bacterium]